MTFHVENVDDPILWLCDEFPRWSVRGADQGLGWCWLLLVRFTQEIAWLGNETPKLSQVQ